MADRRIRPVLEAAVVMGSRLLLSLLPFNKRIMERTMICVFSAKPHPTARSNPGRDALPRVPWNPSANVSTQTYRALAS
jgi:hypothetical protein